MVDHMQMQINKDRLMFEIIAELLYPNPYYSCEIECPTSSSGVLMYWD